MILDQEFRRVACILFTVAQSPAGDDQIAREQRGPALADQPFADDQGLEASLAEVERGIATSGASPDYCNIGRYDPHLISSKAVVCSSHMRQISASGSPFRHVFWVGQPIGPEGADAERASKMISCNETYRARLHRYAIVAFRATL
jgi:hypothetical protein